MMMTEEQLRVIAEFHESPAGRTLGGTQVEVSSVPSGATGGSLKRQINGLPARVGRLLAADGH